MSIFQTNPDLFFNQANWENQAKTTKTKAAKKEQQSLHVMNRNGKFFSRGDEEISSIETSPNQFILLQLNDDPNKRVLTTSEVAPKLAGTADRPDINMVLSFEGFKIGSNEDIDKDSKATLQLTVGQEQNLSNLDKLFYCINGGLDLFNEIKKKKSDAKDFKKSTEEALGKKPIALPAGIGQISLSVVKHPKPSWWQKIFSFAQSGAGKELLSLIGYPGITEMAVNTLRGMMDMLFKEKPEVLFQSMPVKVAFTQAAKTELSGGLSINNVSCLNEGFWIMARKSDYDTIIKSKPIYYGGYGVLAPDGMSEIDAIRDNASNPFSKITYAVIRAKMKEADLKQNIL